MPGRIGRWLRRLALVAGGLLLVLIALALGGGLWLRSAVRGSLPQLEGTVRLEGLTAPVTIERDGLGVPTLSGSSEDDVALATGFLHAQDRFFQMDLLRRSAAGELAELLGPAMLEADRRLRVHRFRRRAEATIRAGSARGRRLLDAYARGVNQGLAALDSAPFEYLLLRTEPVPWRVEDTTLVLQAMFLDLNDERGRYEAGLGLMHDLLPGALFAFLTPRGTEWDAPIVGPAFRTPPIPGPEVVDLRQAAGEDESTEAGAPGATGALRDARSLDEPQPSAGSNNWAVAGAHTAHGGALLATDMHLRLALPNIWYRASIRWSDRENGEARRVTGLTLPGVPGVVAGSTGRIAWGFTNSYGDWSDLVIIEPDPDDPERYLTPDGSREFERHAEVLRVNACAGALFGCDGVSEAETIEVLETVWGPIVDEDPFGRRRAVRWIAHDREAVNLGLLELARAEDVDAAIEIANRAGIPPQNFVVADAGGRIAWTVAGRVPRRVGFDGRVPTSWADGARRWDGWLDPADYPRIVDPPSGRLWTANARVGGADVLDRVGDGGYALGARAGQIRDDLLALERADEAALLAVQLDDRALFLERWRSLLLELLSPRAIEGHGTRAELRRLVERSWTGHASVDSVAYRMVRAFRQFAGERVFATLTAPCLTVDPDFRYRHRQQEGPLWRLVTERPAHLLDPEFESWKAWLLAAVDDTIAYFVDGDERPLSERTWGERNTVRITHPLTGAAPALGRWLSAPREPLPGDTHMPRVQGVSSGASQRMVVSPGREASGLFHMPGGQSGHPLSPHYLDGHAAWAEGRPTPFLPGPAARVLILEPSRG